MANRAVVGLDRNPGTIRIARGLAPALGLTNATFDAGDVTETARFDDASFDGAIEFAGLTFDLYLQRLHGGDQLTVGYLKTIFALSGKGGK